MRFSKTAQRAISSGSNFDSDCSSCSSSSYESSSCSSSSYEADAVPTQKRKAGRLNLKKKNSNKSKNEDIVSVVSFKSTLSAVSTSMRNAVGTVGNTLDMMLESIPMSSDEDDSDFESAESAESVESDYEYNDDSNKRGQSFVKKVKRVMHKKMSQTDNEDVESSNFPSLSVQILSPSTVTSLRPMSSKSTTAKTLSSPKQRPASTANVLSRGRSPLFSSNAFTFSNGTDDKRDETTISHVKKNASAKTLSSPKKRPVSTTNVSSRGRSPLFSSNAFTYSNVVDDKKDDCSKTSKSKKSSNSKKIMKRRSFMRPRKTSRCDTNRKDIAKPGSTIETSKQSWSDLFAVDTFTCDMGMDKKYDIDFSHNHSIASIFCTENSELNAKASETLKTPKGANGKRSSMRGRITPRRKSVCKDDGGQNAEKEAKSPKRRTPRFSPKCTIDCKVDGGQNGEKEAKSPKRRTPRCVPKFFNQQQEIVDDIDYYSKQTSSFITNDDDSLATPKENTAAIWNEIFSFMQEDVHVPHEIAIEKIKTVKASARPRIRRTFGRRKSNNAYISLS